jgi:hypothetical protein
MLPTWELTNPQNMAYSLTRTTMMIQQYLFGNDAIVQEKRLNIGLPPDSLEIAGLSIGDFIAVVLALHAQIGSLEPEKLLSGESNIAIDKNTFLSRTKLSPAVLEAFLQKHSRTATYLRKTITRDMQWDLNDIKKQFASAFFATDFLVFRKYPILDLENGKYLILDFQFLTDLLYSGLYFDIFFSLDNSNRDEFNSLWGRVFELYVSDMLKDFYPSLSNMLSLDIDYPNGQIDALLDFGSYLLIMEIKFLLIEHKTKFGRNKNDFEKVLRTKLIENKIGRKKGIGQLSESILALQRSEIPSISALNRPIYPVLVVSDSSLVAPGINAWLNCRFREILDSRADQKFIKPLTVISINELENALAYTQVGDLTWDKILETRFDSTEEVSLISVQQAIHNLLPARASARNNTFLMAGFDKIWAEMQTRYGFPSHDSD